MVDLGLNPFVYDDPLPPSELVDRVEEAERLLTLAHGGHNTRLSAPRRYGKTSLLLKVLDAARRDGLHTVYVDFFRALSVTEVVRRLEEGYLRDLAGPVRRTVQSTVRSLRLQATPGGVGAELELGRAGDPRARLSSLLDLPKRVHGRSGVRTLIVFDEFQDFLRLESDIDGLIRSKIQFHRDEASYVFAGSEPGLLAELFGDRRRPLYDQARPVELPPLRDDDLAEYIGARFEAAGREAGEGLDALLDLVRGHPQRAMLVAHHLFERTPRGGVADHEAFGAALDAVDRETKERFEQTWQALGRAPNQRRVLVALANGPGSLYSAPTLAEVGLSKAGAESGLRGLIAAGEVRGTPSGPQLVDPLLQRWLTRRDRTAGEP